ncbi:endonuclease domain-containing protein [Pseudoclavibacter sp. CFCC 13611]|uniref:endonuclease domain-containing protein n=1 Tax=Pseudoclavibacter sp. CFCC 13611 TaxID=2615178 RepID=UPI001300E936|nr:DUF559 domain-containing protein [Pseudoclavibacter sp. CFCC 13611]KAB1664053.1 DUF559 domain-containing protein [Pseudoclavibacter sp. CFCC 13611]
MPLPHRFSPFGVCTTATLARAGISRWQIRSLHADGTLTTVRTGWHAERNAESAVLAAVQAGGVLSGLHRLKLLADGIWLPPNSPPHMYTHHPAHAQGWVGHRWPRLCSPDVQFGVVPTIIALRHGLSDQPLEQAVAVVDSPARFCTLAKPQRNRQSLTLSPTDLFAELSRTPFGRRVIAYSDSAAESGLESIVRVLLTLAGHHVETQVVIARSQRIDLVVDEILAIEVDGRTHDGHQRTLQDRAKEADIRAAGYRLARYSYPQIMQNWAGVYADILRLLTMH